MAHHDMHRFEDERRMRALPISMASLIPLLLQLLLLPIMSHSFLTTPALSRSPFQGTRCYEQQPQPQPYFNQADGQYYYYYEGDGHYYTETGQPYISTKEQELPNSYQQQQYDQPQQYQGERSHNDMPSPQERSSASSLLITSNMQQEMARATYEFGGGGIDYLSLARQRAAERRESSNSQSTDDDWKQLAREKRRIMTDEKEVGFRGTVDEDGWEASLVDEGNQIDVAALGMTVKLEEREGGMLMTESGLLVDRVNDDDDELQLLL